MTATAAAWADALVAGLAGPGWGLAAAFAEPALVRALAADAAHRDTAGEFRAAAVGAGRGRAVRPEIRGDRICWLLGAGSAAERVIIERFETLRTLLNRALMLGLAEFECHYARYDAGARYARHRDRSPHGAERVVSAVLYLNDAWDDGDGGELVLAVDPCEATIAPRGGTLVTFLSERFEHEVRPARRTRLSLAGWYRRAPFAAPL